MRFDFELTESEFGGLTNMFERLAYLSTISERFGELNMEIGSLKRDMAEIRAERKEFNRELKDLKEWNDEINDRVEEISKKK